MKRMTALACSAVLGVSAAAVGASPASAVCAEHPSDPAIGCVNSYPTLTGCDYQVDGHRVRAWYKNGAHEIAGRWAPSGRCIDDVGLLYWPEYVRICVEEEGCSGWKQHV